MDWKTELDNKTRSNSMKCIITGWILIILSIFIVITYPYFAETFNKLNGPVLMGWWAFGAGFFCAGIFFLTESFTKLK